ncbi:MAG TPA: DUF4417 domain-containing protein [Candidatus Saccharibacteria bacterium]|nr:DUF4417 domain-containing protein [Candidatus Saccharibacteria bacterium]HMT55846.1 DUF4417 domain-containing protein [Candidatus Saccharibacteria bacterium]
MDFIDDEDGHCNNYEMASVEYQPLAEDSEDHQFQMASVEGPYLNTVTAVEQQLPRLPVYVPGIQKGSSKLLAHTRPAWVGVHLGEVVSRDKLLTPADVHMRMGVPAETKLLLLAYGKDRLIENIWPKRGNVLRRLAALGFDLVTSINYSIWDIHPHPEKIFNVKRSLVVYEEMQALGITTVPHIYWYSRKSLVMWANWLNVNVAVQIIAMDVQTLKAKDWATFADELRAFKGLLTRQIHFIITGPVAPSRIAELRQIVGSFTLTNSYASQCAWHRTGLRVADGRLVASNPTQDLAKLFDDNVAVFNQLMTV